MWYGPGGPEAATLGLRISDRFGRVYDKGLESGAPEYEGCLRYELELHREPALRTAKALDSQEHDQALIVDQVLTFARDRGLKVIFAGDILRSASMPKGLATIRRDQVPEVVRAVRWLHNSVRPCVQRLIEAGYEQEVQRALGILLENKMDQVVHSPTWNDFQRWR